MAKNRVEDDMAEAMDRTCEILEMMFITKRGNFEKMAKQEKTSLSSLAAAAIGGFLAQNYVLTRHGDRAMPRKPSRDAGGLTIPPIPKKLDLPVRSLARTASFFYQLCGAAFDGQNPVELATEHEEMIRRGERVLEVWRDHLGLEVEDLLDSIDDDPDV